MENSVISSLDFFLVPKYSFKTAKLLSLRTVERMFPVNIFKKDSKKFVCAKMKRKLPHNDENFPLTRK